MIRWLFCFTIFATATAHAADFSGSVHKVVDGDTLWLCDVNACHKIRVCGINAPDRGEPGYAESSAALAALVKGKSIRCVQVGAGTPCDGRSKTTSRDRIVAQCFAEATDIAAPMVEQGFACDWIKFSGGHYSQNGKGKSCETPIQTGASEPDTNLEAQTLARMKQLEQGMDDLNLAPATKAHLLQQGLKSLLESYCLQSRLREQGQ